MAHLNPLGRNWGEIVNWDDLGKAYAGLIVGWTVILVSGIVWLVANRQLPFIRMRNLPLAISSTVFLHVYLVKILLAYTTNGHFYCSAEFWIMSIYLPFGIALFQANVLQLRSISVQQERLLHSRQSSTASLASGEPRRTGLAGMLSRWRDLTEVQKGYFYIGIGMLVQLIITGVLYATSPVLQGDWSSFGNIPYPKAQAKCRKTFDFIPSAFWQLFWSWVYGPYTLFKVRKVRDVHHWRLQTVLSILAGLPGSPLWLAALYSPGFKPVNKWFVPPMWLAPGIVVMQFVTIFFPVYGIFEHRNAMKQDYYSDSDDGSYTTFDSMFSEKKTAHSSTNKLFEELAATGSMDGRNMYRMVSLEKALIINPLPLLHFAATRDFTAENIVFLMSVKEWKAAWVSAPRYLGTDEVTEHARSQLYKMAVEIFLTTVHHQTAEIPLNLEGPIVNDLNTIFAPNIPGGGFHKLTGGDGEAKVNPADVRYGIQPRLDLAFIEEPRRAWEKNASASSLSRTSITVPNISPLSVDSTDYDYFPRGAVNSQIHSAFDEHVFDAAEASTKFLVLTNTWRRFVKDQEDRTSA